MTDGRRTALQAFTWHVTTLALTNPGPHDDAAGMPLRLDIQVSAPGLPLSVAASGLPGGLTLRTDSRIHTWWIDGVATTAAIGPHTVTLTASADGTSITKSFAWTIGPNAPPTLVNPGPQFTAGGQPVTLQLQASNPYSDPTAFAAPLGLPPGLRLDGATGLISGVIPFGVGGTFLNVQITVRVRAPTASRIFTWTVRRNDPPMPARNSAARLTNEGADVRLQARTPPMSTRTR